MTDPNTVTGIVNIVTAVLPGIFEMIRAAHGATRPDTVTITDAQIAEALQQAIAASLAKDAAWLAAHPTVPGA